MDKRPIGVFDSGVGGLTAVRELIRLLPNENVVYLGDTARVPYGTKSRETIEKYAKQDAEFLLSQNVKIIIAACGTVSAVAPHIGKTLPVPYITVLEPTVTEAARATKNGHIGVIATAATIKSGSYERLLSETNPKLKIFSQACPLFVPLVEEGLTDTDNPVTKNAVEMYLKNIKEQDVDTVILGCTHYPLLSEAISQYLDGTVLINSGGAAAAQCVKLLIEKDMLNTEAKPVYKYFITDSIDGFSKFAKRFLPQSEFDVKQIIL